MTKPRFTPDPLPDGLDPSLASFLQRQFDRINDWWPKDLEDRVKALEKSYPYIGGTWPIVDYSTVEFNGSASATDVVNPFPHAWVNLVVLSHCKFKDSEAYYAAPFVAYAQRNASDACYGAASTLHLMSRFCDFDFAAFGSDAGYCWRGTATIGSDSLGFNGDANAEAIEASGYQLGYHSNYYHPDIIYTYRISLGTFGVDYRSDSTNKLTHGTSQYDGTDPVPTTNPYGNIIHVDPGTGNLRAAVNAASDGDILILRAGVHVIDTVGGVGIDCAKNIVLYGETENPDDVIITNDASIEDWGGFRFLWRWRVSSASPVPNGPTCSSPTKGEYVFEQGFSPGFYHVTFDTSPHGNVRICFLNLYYGL